MVYYREENGDFLAIDPATNDYYRRYFGQDQFEGQAEAARRGKSDRTARPPSAGCDNCRGHPANVVAKASASTAACPR